MRRRWTGLVMPLIWLLDEAGDRRLSRRRQDFLLWRQEKQVEKSTRVRARVKAHALRQVIEGKEQVAIMGHKIGDWIVLVRQSVSTERPEA